MLEKIVLAVIDALAENESARQWLARHNLWHSNNLDLVADQLAKQMCQLPEAALAVATFLAIAKNHGAAYEQFLAGEGEEAFREAAIQQMSPSLPPLNIKLPDEEPVDEGPAGWDETVSYDAQKNTRLKGLIGKFLEHATTEMWPEYPEAMAIAHQVKTDLRGCSDKASRKELREKLRDERAKRMGTTAETPAAPAPVKPAPPKKPRWTKKHWHDLGEDELEEVMEFVTATANRYFPAPRDSAKWIWKFLDLAEPLNWEVSASSIGKFFRDRAIGKKINDAAGKFLATHFPGKKLEDDEGFRALGEELTRPQNPITPEEAISRIRHGLYGTLVDR